MTMRLPELQKKILTAIKTKLSHKDLCSLCLNHAISSVGLKRNVQERLETFIHSLSYNQLVVINNTIEDFLKITKKTTLPAQVMPDVTKYDNSASSYQADSISDALLAQAPIKLEDELTMINRCAMVVVLFTSYPTAQTPVPTQTVTGINERAHSVRLPNMLPHVPVQISPFYCCSTCLHPLSLLIPHTMPNIPQNNRITSHATINFFLSDDACKLIARNCQTTSTGKKVDYKWQVLLRFVAIDPTMSLPTPGQSVSQVMPSYLNLNVNNEITPLWEILPSNCRIKEGRRHPKPVNITERLNVVNRAKNGYRQNINIDWWQTPGVFQYFYVGVYLERKLSVREILDLFASNRHVNNLPIESTMALIRSKLKQRSNEDDDDMVVSSVLPISLSCPVGRSRIEIPIRTLNCQHLQCFDAHLFLCMNERRSVWKCPVCESSATPNELFCDKYFQEILQIFKDSDDINDINVNYDGTYVPVMKNKDDKVDSSMQTSDGIISSSKPVDSTIVLDSDEEGDTPQKVRSPHKLNRSSNNILKKTLPTNKNKQSPVVIPFKLNHSIDVLNENINSDTSSLNSMPKDKPPYFNPISLQSEPMTTAGITTVTTGTTETILSKSSITVGPSNVRITAPLSSSGLNYLSPRTTISLSSNSFAIPPPTYIPSSSLSLTSSSTNSIPNIFSCPSFKKTSSVASSHTVLQKMYQVSSILGTTCSPIAAPIQAPLVSSVQSPFPSAIPAPNQPTSIFAAIHASSGSHLPAPIKTPEPPTSSSFQDNIFSLKPNPISALDLESRIKIKPTTHHINGTIQSIFESLNHSSSSAATTATTIITPTISNLDLSWNSKDVIRTPLTNVNISAQQSITNVKDLITKPISCPTITVDKPIPVNGIEKEKGTSLTKPQERHRASLNDVIESIGKFPDNILTSTPSVVQTDSVSQTPVTLVAKSETARRTKPPMAPPAGAVNIPSVSIDLTEDDDEEESIISNEPQATIRSTKVPQALRSSNNTKWCNINSPALQNNILNNRFSVTDRPRLSTTSRQMTNNNISHYQTQSMKRPMVIQKPIDLTADDDEEDNDSGLANERVMFAAAQKRLRMTPTEDGQINDSDDDSMGSSSTTSSTSSSSSDSLRKHSGTGVQAPLFKNL